MRRPSCSAPIIEVSSSRLRSYSPYPYGLAYPGNSAFVSEDLQPVKIPLLKSLLIEKLASLIALFFQVERQGILIFGKLNGCRVEHEENLVIFVIAELSVVAGLLALQVLLLLNAFLHLPE